MTVQARATAVAAVLTLSLTLGVGTAILALINAVLLTPPPFADPDSLVVLSETPSGEASAQPRRPTFGTFEEWRDAAGSMATLEAVDGTNVTLTGLGAAERIGGNDVTPGFLRQLGVTPARGRSFEATDAGQPVVIVSDRLWREKLGSDPNAIGRVITLGDTGHTIIGVMPKASNVDLMSADFWRPIPFAITPEFRSSYRVSVYARMSHRIPASALISVLDGVSRNSSPRAFAVSTPIKDQIAGDARKTLGVLAGAAAIAALLAFVNIGGLLVVRSLERQRELAIRSALGASPSDIATQRLFETQTLVAIGVAIGILLAVWITPPFARLTLEQFGGAVSVDWRVIAIIAAMASICGALCAVPAALASARRDVVDTLRRGATPPPRELKLRRMFVAVQVALAFVLLASVTLLATNLIRLMNTAPGFDPSGVLAMKISLPSANYNDERVVSFYSALQKAIAGRLGQGAIAGVNEVPLDGSVSRRVLRLRPDDSGREAVVREVTPDYFKVMRVAQIAGRSFDERDNTSSRRIIVSQSLADALGFAQPVGQSLWYSKNEQAEIVGVVADVKHQSLDEPFQPTMYIPAAQSPSRSMVLVARSAHPDADVIAAVREEVARLDASLPVYGVSTLTDIVSRSRGMRERRVITATFVGFGVLAIVIAGVGLLAVTAHDVLSRRKEFALRIAIGARPTRVVSDIVRQAAMMVAAGTSGGAFLSVAVNSALMAAGFATSRVSPLAIGVPVIVIAVAGALALSPAIRAALASDPVTILRG